MRGYADRRIQRGVALSNREDIVIVECERGARHVEATWDRHAAVCGQGVSRNFFAVDSDRRATGEVGSSPRPVRIMPQCRGTALRHPLGTDLQPRDYWSREVGELGSVLSSGPGCPAPQRLNLYGANELRERRIFSRLSVLGSQLRRPLLLLLVFAAGASVVSGDRGHEVPKLCIFPSHAACAGAPADDAGPLAIVIHLIDIWWDVDRKPRPGCLLATASEVEGIDHSQRAMFHSATPNTPRARLVVQLECHRRLKAVRREARASRQARASWRDRTVLTFLMHSRTMSLTFATSVARERLIDSYASRAMSSAAQADCGAPANREAIDWFDRARPPASGFGCRHDGFRQARRAWRSPRLWQPSPMARTVDLAWSTHFQAHRPPVAAARHDAHMRSSMPMLVRVKRPEFVDSARALTPLCVKSAVVWCHPLRRRAGGCSNEPVAIEAHPSTAWRDRVCLRHQHARRLGDCGLAHHEPDVVDSSTRRRVRARRARGSAPRPQRFSANLYTNTEGDRNAICIRDRYLHVSPNKGAHVDLPVVLPRQQRTLTLSYQDGEAACVDSHRRLTTSSEHDPVWGSPRQIKGALIGANHRIRAWAERLFGTIADNCQDLSLAAPYGRGVTVRPFHVAPIHRTGFQRPAAGTLLACSNERSAGIF